MRAFLVAALLFSIGCTRRQECGTLMVCAGGARSFALCKADNECYYVATGDQRFECASCDDCSAATARATTWCATGDGTTTGGTSAGTTTGGTTTGESCQAGTCASSPRSYQFCTTGSQCRYLTTDGQAFACNGCDCSSAANLVSKWCAAGGTTATTGGSTTAGTTGGTTSGTTGGTTGGTCSGGTTDQCGLCCAQLHPSGVAFAQKTIYPCLCMACSTDCAASQICGGTGATSDACTSCAQNAAFGACQAELNKCFGDSECQAFVFCVQNC